MNTSLNITGVFGTALRLYRKHWAILLLCALVIYAVPAATLFVIVVIAPEVKVVARIILGVVTLFMLTTGGFWYRALTTHLILATRKGEDPKLGTLVRRAFKGFPRVSTVGFLVFFGTVFGLLLFVVPGLIFAARRSPALSVAVVEGKGAFYGRRYRDPEHSAMRRSRDLVKQTGNSFEVFAVIASKNVVYNTFISIVPLLFIIVVPWGSLGASLCYFEMVDIEAGHREPPASAGQSPLAPAADSAWRPAPRPRANPEGTKNPPPPPLG